MGRRIVAPKDVADETAAKTEAILRPTIMKEFFQKYHRAKFPKDDVAEKQLINFGLHEDRAKEAVSIVKENGRFAGIIRDTKTGLFLTLGPSAIIPASGEESTGEVEPPSEPESQGIEEPGKKEPLETEKVMEKEICRGNKVYISHGKNKAIVGQLKELLIYGKFDPVISIERETTSISVPEKVFDDMKKCSAAVIHVSSEGAWTDADGNDHDKINDNVLIEIGGALSLYGKNFVLLVEKGVALPSNLQGLYRCDYEGDKLDYDATMKLLKIFNAFK